MAVLDRADLEASPLADLHAIAGQIGLDGYRKLRKADLIDLILERSGAGAGAGSGGEIADAAARRERPAEPRRGRGGRRRRGTEEEREQPEDEGGEAEPAGRRRARGERRGVKERGGAQAQDAERQQEREREQQEEMLEGEVEVLANGSAFLRLSPPEPSDGDVYISAAQVRRCELLSGDRVGGPVRKPRRSERHPSLVRVETVNGQPAESGVSRYESLPAAYPTERFELDGQEKTLKAIEWLTPLGRGSRAVIVGAARSGKTETLRLLIGALSGREGLTLTLLLAGVRPEEVSEWQQGRQQPATASTLAAGPDALGREIEQALESAKRAVARGAHVVLAIDTLDALHPHTARKALAAARNIPDGGSLTVIGTASRPFGGETTVIALDVARTSTGRLPALDLAASGTLKAELLVGQENAEEILKARAAAVDGAPPQPR